MTMIEFVETLGMRSLEILWLPLLAWTVFWLVLEGVLFLRRDRHPAARYRAYQAVLISLPIGIVVAFAADVSSLIPVSPVYVIFEQPAMIMSPPAALEAGVAFESGWKPSLSLMLGIGVVLGAVAALVQTVRLTIDAVALGRYRRSLRASATGASTRDFTAGLPASSNSVELIETEKVTVPMTFGLLRPVVVIPSSLNTHDRWLALAHELVHVRQYDYLAQWLESFVAAVFAIHPGVHILRRRCDLMREMACDAHLLRDPAVNPRSYADLLFRLVHPPSIPQPASVSMADSKPHLHRRLHAMKSYSRYPNINPVRSAWTAAALIVILGAGTLVVPQVVAQRAEAPLPLPHMAEAPPSLQLPFDIEGPDAPFWIMDGEPIEGGWNAIDPASIRSFEVLKGDLAFEEYGERGRNGVIRITTGEAVPPTSAPRASEPDTSAYVVVESMPVLIGGLASIQQQLRYPEEARATGLEGRVFVRFIVDEEGNVVDPEVTRGVGAGLDEEALRVIRNAHFEPGTQGGEPVRVQMAIPITFRLGAESAAAAQKSEDSLPTSFAVTGAHPNPFNATTTLRIDLPEDAEVGVEIFDVTGRRVMTLPPRSFPAGAGHSFRIDGTSLASGSYVYRVSVVGGGATQTASGNLTLVR